MHPQHDIFVHAIQSKRKVLLRYLSNKDSSIKTKLCVPIDYSRSFNREDVYDCYHFWDCRYGINRFPLVLFSNQVVSIKIAEQVFDPKEFITWDTKKRGWFMERNWGRFS